VRSALVQPASVVLSLKRQNIQHYGTSVRLISMATQTELTHRQHKLSQWHLRNFTNANGDLWCYRPNVPAKLRRPKSVCWEFDFYEYELNGYTTRNEYECWFGRIEDDAATRCPAILNRQRLGQKDAAAWATYVASLFIRSSKCRDHIISSATPKFREETRSPDFIRNLQHNLLKKGMLMPADELRQFVESRRANMEGSASYYHLAAIKETASSLADALMRKTWHTLEAAPGLVFVLGDCPVSTVEFVGNQVLHGAGFNNENAAILLPLTPQHVFVASPPGRQWRSVMQLEQVAPVNLLSIRYAKDVVLSSVNAPETQALVNAEINQVVFGRDAFIPPCRN
jgi:hypothetical protein